MELQLISYHRGKEAQRAGFNMRQIRVPLGSFSIVATFDVFP
ncbi:hypothetical protein COLO4_03010 [Corchorus olitorius]|uniref:Uncharacterized protein n=1 Tax=Corchorus olitorius TaxID=93759 RepID=A0A1R3KZP4_9ROSI|nr:hypothetical protein COLO4_03010 [Corchorus olitorius]